MYFTNAVTEIVAGKDCRIDHCKLQQESREAFHVATMQVNLGRGATFVSHSATIGAKLTRNDLNCHMVGDGAYATLNGLVLVGGDAALRQPHAARPRRAELPQPRAVQARAGRQEHGVFKGKILVRQPAQKTDSKQTSKSLLLSDDATMNSQPALEIYADDVKCTHGCTIGPVDEDMVFYLRSRGVGLDAARHLLTYAFAADITRRIKVEPVRRRLEDFMAAQHGLPQDLRITDLGAFDEARRRRRRRTSLPRAVANRECQMQRVADIPKPKPPSMPFDPLKVRNDFPILHTKVYGKPLVYLDNGATTQKPRAVIDAVSSYYESQNANIHRGVYHLSQVATTLYEERARRSRKFINAPDARVIFTRGTTEGINLVAACWGRDVPEGGRRSGRLRDGAPLEHRPLADRLRATGAKLRVIPMNECGELQLDALRDMLAGGKVRLISVVHLSNSLGTINDVKTIAKLAHEKRRAGDGRRCAVGRPLPDGRAGPRRRLLRLLRPQALRPDRHRRAVGQARAARADAAVPGRRRHDRVGHVREDDLRGAAEQVRSRHAGHRRRRRPRRGDRLRRRR